MLRKELKNAVKDLRYLLSNSYNRKGSVSFVGDKYQLDKKERLILYRAVYDNKTATKHQKKKKTVNDIANKMLAIDGYNVIITVESMLTDKPLILCDDGFIRDISAVHGKHKPTSITKNALKMIISLLKEFHPFQVGFFYDSQVSLSGELASLTRNMLQDNDVSGKAEAVKKADVSTLKYGEIVSSSDAVIIKKADMLVDLAGELIKKHAPKKIIKMAII